MQAWGGIVFAFSFRQAGATCSPGQDIKKGSACAPSLSLGLLTARTAALLSAPHACSFILIEISDTLKVGSDWGGQCSGLGLQTDLPA